MDQAIEELRTGIGGSPRRDDQRLGGRIIEAPDRPVCIAQSCIAQFCIAQFCIAQFCIAQFCIAK